MRPRLRFPGDHPRALRRCAAASALALCAVLAVACSQATKSYTMDTKFSVNVGHFAADWPSDPTTLPLAKQDALRTRGRPDFVHIKWSRFEEIVDRTTVSEIMASPEEKKRGRKESWIYLDDGLEIDFPDAADSRVKPLSDQLRQVCRLGDPERVEVRPDAKHPERRVEKWTYYSRGYILTFIDGMLTETISIPRMPHLRNF